MLKVNFAGIKQQLFTNPLQVSNMKFPSERKLTYVTGAVSNGNFADLGKVNLPKDLSILNRRGYDHTTPKGVPLCYKVAVHWYPSGLDGSGYTVTVSTDVRTSLKFLTAPNNWVAKNAGKAWHEARIADMKRTGIKMKQLGAYAKTIRYEWDSASTTWLAPYDGAGNAYAGGTWDTTTIFNTIDEAGFKLRLIGQADDEDSVQTGTDINALHSYLQSRATVRPDSNGEVNLVPSDSSLLLALRQGTDRDADHSAALIADVRGAQDNPPYDEFDGSDTNSDITEPTESARMVMYPAAQSGVISTVFEVPYGIFQVLGCNRDPGDNSGFVDDMSFSVEVLDIYEMQG
jgi:hypothetical protein